MCIMNGGIWCKFPRPPYILALTAMSNVTEMTLDLTDILILFASGLVAVTTIDVLGSISSRKLNYKYVYLTPISFLVYFCIGYQGHSIATLTWTLVIVCLIGT